MQEEIQKMQYLNGKLAKMGSESFNKKNCICKNVVKSGNFGLCSGQNKKP